MFFCSETTVLSCIEDHTFCWDCFKSRSFKEHSEKNKLEYINDSITLKFILGRLGLYPDNLEKGSKEWACMLAISELCMNITACVAFLEGTKKLKISEFRKFDEHDYRKEDIQRLCEKFPVLNKYTKEQIESSYAAYCEEHHAASWTIVDEDNFVKWALTPPIEGFK